MLIGRDAEINLLNQYYMRADDQVMMMYGLEGVGKSTLVREFSDDTPGSLYFECKPLFEREQLYHWANYSHKGLKLSEYPDFASLFSAIDNIDFDGSKLVLIFDEFLYLIKYYIFFT